MRYQLSSSLKGFMQDLVWAEISLSALKHNFATCKAAAPEAKIIAVIKANGYGHGAVTVARALPQADYFATARLDEALQLRSAGINTSILVLSGIIYPDDILLCHKHNIDIVVHSLEVLTTMLNLEFSSKLNIWIKVDTGMHRLGIEADQLHQALSSIASRNDIDCHGVISHLASADDVSSAKSSLQLSVLMACIESHNLNTISFANSAAILNSPETHYDYIRPGIMLYGIDPTLANSTIIPKLRPVMTLKTTVLNVRDIPTGASVGYNETWTATKPSRIATLAIGYADGYPRHAKNGTPIKIGGKLYPLIGRVSMDLITVDITNSNIRVGDEAVLWGESPTASDVAMHADTIAYQLFTSVSERVPRRIVE